MTGTLSSLSPYAKCLVAAEAALPLAGRALISYYLSVSYSLWMEEDKPHLHFCVTVSPLAMSSMIFRDVHVIVDAVMTFYNMSVYSYITSVNRKKTPYTAV